MIKKINDENLSNMLDEFAKLKDVEGILLAGSRAVKADDNFSDYDVYIYVNKDIEVSVRKEITDKYCEYMELDNRFWETEDDELKYKLMWLVSNSQKDSMEPVMLTLEEGGKYLLDEPHVGEEFGYVLKGSIIVKLGNKKFRVKTGESFYFKSNVNHQIYNAGKTSSRILWISSPPSF